jgi:hypothetical protein
MSGGPFGRPVPLTRRPFQYLAERPVVTRLLRELHQLTLQLTSTIKQNSIHRHHHGSVSITTCNLRSRVTLSRPIVADPAPYPAPADDLVGEIGVGVEERHRIGAGQCS